MDFIKVLNRHTIFEYTDLSDSEFTAWIKIMSLTAYLEKEPTREQMLKHVHHKTLSGLQDKLKKHSTTLQDILKKVLSDVQEVVKRRESWKQKQKQKRERAFNVSGDVPGYVSPKIKRREREDIEIDIKNNPPTPQGGTSAKVLRERFNRFYTAYPKKKSKGQAEKAFSKINPDEHLLATMIATIERATKSEDWIKENGKFIPYPASWLNAKGWEDEPVVIKQRQPNIPPEVKLPICDRCEREAELVEHRGMNVCQACLRELDPDIDERIKGLLSQIGART